MALGRVRGDGWMVVYPHKSASHSTSNDCYGKKQGSRLHEGSHEFLLWAVVAVGCWQWQQGLTLLHELHQLGSGPLVILLALADMQQVAGGQQLCGWLHSSAVIKKTVGLHRGCCCWHGLSHATGYAHKRKRTDAQGAEAIASWEFVSS